jgi:hypothetical protein
MRMRRLDAHSTRATHAAGRALPLLVVCVALAATDARAAALPTGHARGVHIRVTTHTVVFRFGPYLDFGVRELVSARRVELRCTWLQPARLDGYRPWGAWNRRLRAPRHLQSLRLHHQEPIRPSFCSIWQIKPVYRSLVDVAITEDGAIYLDERHTFLALTDAAYNASSDAKEAGTTTFPTAEQMVDEYSHSNSGTAVALASPADTPAPGKLGIFSDGAHHFEAVRLTTLGRRLFYDLNGDVLTTNGQTYL